MTGTILNSAKIQGFRGINELEEIKFGPNITILRGQNGQGKTSILQAIEFAITGELPEFKSFTKEDALVNSYAQKPIATVSLVLSAQNDNFTIKRVRKKSSSSRTSKTNTRIEIEKNGNSIPNAETELQSLIGIEDETFKNYYIKQDSIRAIINEKPEEQSRGIEQVLGTAEIREFIDALNKKRNFSSARKELTSVIDSLKESSSDYEANLMEQADEKKQELLKSDFQESELTIENVQKKTKQLRDKLKKISEKITDDIPEFSIGISLEELEEFLSNFKELIDSVDKTRQEDLSTKNDEKTIIGENLASIKGHQKSLSKLIGNMDFSKQKEKLKQIKTDLRTEKSEIKKITDNEQELSDKNQSIEDEKKQFIIFDNQLKKQEEKDPKKLGEKLDDLKQENDKLNDKIEQNQGIIDNCEEIIPELAAIFQNSKSIKQGSVLDIQNKISGLKGKITDLEKRRPELTEEDTKLSNQITELTTIKQELKINHGERKKIQDRIEKSTQKYGDEKQHEHEISKCKKLEEEYDNEIATIGEFDTLLTNAVGYIKNNKNDSCPVCEQSIKPDKLITSLNNRIKTGSQQKIETLEGKRKSVVGKSNAIDADLTKLKGALDDIKQNKKDQTELIKDISKILGKQVGESVNVDVLTEKLKETQKKYNGELTKVNQELPVQTTEHKNLKEFLEQKENLDEKIDQIFTKYSMDKSKKSISGMEQLITKFKETKKNTTSDNAAVEKQIRALGIKEATIRGQKESVEDILENLNDSKDSLNDILETNVSLEKIIDVTSTSADKNKKQLESYKTDRKNSEKNKLDLEKDETRIKENIERIIEINQEITGAESKLQDVTNSSQRGAALLKTAESYNTQLESDLQELKASGKIHSGIDEIKNEVTKLIDGPLDFLSLQKRAEDKQEEETLQKKKIKSLKTRRERLEIFENSLKNIQSASNEYLRENTSNLIDTHRQQIEKTYNKIVRHPTFEHIKLDVQSTDPLVYSIMVYDDKIDLSTQAATRLSSAQMNSFAISVLITNNLNKSSKLSFLMMDDPTQSMDSQHKEALTKLIAEICDKRQIIIATSDDEFLKYLHDNCSEKLKSIELKGWSRQGISIA